ncbi:hypothetical protein CCACVL1_06415 [Corchorus capsularis]|uniref:Uncharacterized protein n=1 Tax=Corchorus capsularis TaxID=210143 RepID=A0A1R3JFR6_COCAP|nr:hypothetical protein CCACVL1_06415 [Corchorus capsularis]
MATKANQPTTGKHIFTYARSLSHVSNNN